jgi:hypothetical protein
VPGSGSSNNNGRSLEFLITDSLIKVKGCKPTSRALNDQARDATTIKRIEPKLRSSFTKAAGIVTPWILTEVGVSKSQAFEVDRHSDSDSGVVDITIKCASRSLGVSIKHNHDALKHPRPYSVADWMGLANTNIEIDHRSRMDTAITFPSLPAGAKLKLYQDSCAECAKTVNNASSNPVAVANLFEFLVGSNFKKVIVETNNTSHTLRSISVSDYTKIKTATSVKASVDNRPQASSLILTFNNGWTIDMRIKNASTRISPTGQVSLKFDAQKKHGAFPPAVILF